MTKLTSLPTASARRFKDLTRDQLDTIAHLGLHPETLLYAKMGSGKTVVTLSAAVTTDVKRWLIVAPVRVARTVWLTEASKWGHLTGVSVVDCTGSAAVRGRALRTKAKFTVINFENLQWFLKQPESKNFDGLIIDELTRLKSVGGALFKKLRYRLNQFSHRWGLTGTPVAENWKGLYGQMLVIDQGKSLGTLKDWYLAKYFYQTDRQGYRHELKPGADAEITRAIKPYTYVMPDYRDLLPPVDVFTVPVDLPDLVSELYDSLKTDGIAQLEDMEDIIAVNEGVGIHKQAQLASGFLYENSGESRQLHWAKLDMLKNLLATLDGPVLILYWFASDRELLKAALGAEVLGAGTPKDDVRLIDQFNRGEISLLLANPRSCGHGIELQGTAHQMVWYSPYWSNDLWEQTIARLWRRGQTKPVEVYVLYVRDTVEAQMLERVSEKAEHDKTFTRLLS